jgi:tripartite-type tricarboxylate transporter receptor subunit TctC
LYNGRPDCNAPIEQVTAMKRRQFLKLSAAAAAGLAAPRSARAQAYPARPVRMIVPFAPGGPTDVAARLIAGKLTEQLGRQFFVENVAGASSNIGTAQAARAAPDGYTVLVTVNNLVINPALFEKVAFDPYKDFDPVALAVSFSSAFAVHPSVTARTVREFVDYAKANPGRLSFASPGLGTPSHLLGEQFRVTVGLDLVHVPFGGSGPAIAAAVAGHTPICFAAMSAAAPQARDGKLRVLAVMSKNVSSSMPEVPTIAAAGYPGLEGDGWVGALVPAGTPKDIVALLNREIVRIIALPELKERFTALGLDPVGGSADAFAQQLREEGEKWAKVIKAANIKAAGCRASTPKHVIAERMRDDLAHQVRQRLARQVRNPRPAGALGRGSAGRNVGGIDGEPQRKVREDVRDRAGEAPPRRLAARRTRHRCEGIGLVEVVRPRRRRHLGHAAEQAGRRTCAHKDVAVGAHQHERGAASQPPLVLRTLDREGLRIAAPARGAGREPRAQDTARLLRRADRGAEVHQRLGEIARPPRRHQRLHARADVRLGGRQGGLDREQSRHHPLDIAVDRRGAGTEGDRGDGGRRVGTDAGQVGKFRLARRKMPAVTRHHRSGAGVQVARAGVVAKPGPELEHVIEIRGSERAHVRPALRETLVIGGDRLHRRLLQHDLGQPDTVGIRRLARLRPPRQPATMTVVPGQKTGRRRRRTLVSGALSQRRSGC